MSACTSAGLAVVNLPTIFSHDYTIQNALYGAEAHQALDIYVPVQSGANTQKDVVVFIHGGRWQSGDKEDYRFVGAALAARGFIVVIPDYRQYPEVRFPVFVQDNAKALAWVDDNIETYGGNPARIHLAGHSSGAHIGALLSADETYLAAEGKNTRAVICSFAGLAGPYAFTPGEKSLEEIFGPPERYPLMQVPTFIDGGEPAMFLMYGGQDQTVAPYNYQKLAARIREKDGRVRVKAYPTLGHSGMIGTFSALGPTSDVVKDLVDFFKENGAGGED